MKAAVPENIQILTLEPWKGTSFLLRLEHILEKVDDPSASQPIVVNLQVSFVVIMIKQLNSTQICLLRYKIATHSHTLCLHKNHNK